MKFQSIPSNAPVKRQLKELAASGRIPHAILLHGPSGIGKMLMARTFAALLHCENPGADGEPCGECPACRQGASLNHVDTIYVFPVVKDKSSNPVSADYMEEFREFISRSPYMDYDKWCAMLAKKNAQPQIYVSESSSLEERLSVSTVRSKYKVVIMWLPEKLHEAAANKLLKLIEEPLGETVFLLVSDEPGRILPTIRSRCRPVEMMRLADEDIAAELERMTDMDHAEAMAAAHVAEGNMTSALRALDATGTSRMFFDYFVGLMRMAYSRDVAGLKTWSADVAALGRESEIRFYVYCTRFVRENFIYNFREPRISYLTKAEEQFARNFSRFIHEGNVERIVAEMDRAAAEIGANANGKIVNFDFAVKMIILLVKK